MIYGNLLRVVFAFPVLQNFNFLDRHALHTGWVKDS